MKRPKKRKTTHSRKKTPSRRGAARGRSVDSAAGAVVDAARLTSARAELAAIREPLFADMRELERDPTYEQPPEPHLACTRAHNRMRISTLEAIDIILAFRENPALQRKWPTVQGRITAARAKLRDDERRQAYDCPLLEGTQCLVHELAKPIPCLAWNPGIDFTDAGWQAFADRDQLNNDAIGSDWELKAIPVTLVHAARMLGVELGPVDE